MRKHIKSLLTVVATAVIAVAVDRRVMRFESPKPAVGSTASEVTPCVMIGEEAYTLPKLVDRQHETCRDPELSLNPPSHDVARLIANDTRGLVFKGFVLQSHQWECKRPSPLSEEFERDSLALLKLAELFPTERERPRPEDLFYAWWVSDWLAGSNVR